jgi:hypothetical protein
MAKLTVYYDAIYHDSRPRRLVDLPRLAQVGFEGIASNFTPDDEPALKLCSDLKLDVLYEPNGISWAESRSKHFDKFPNIKAVVVADDANQYDPNEVTRRRDEAKRHLRADQETFITVAKGTDATKYAPLCDRYGVQLYVWREGTLRKWYWDELLKIRAACRGQLVVHPWLAKSCLPAPVFDGQALWEAEEYQPLDYTEASYWLAICAGADEILGYTAYSINPAYPRFRSHFLSRVDLVEGLKEILRVIKEYRPFLAGQRTPFGAAGERVVGAVFTRTDGARLRVSIDTHEQRPKVYFEQPRKAEVEVWSREGVRP